MSSIHTVVKICTICLDTDTKLYVMSEYQMGKAYENLTGLTLRNMVHAKFVCSECIHRLLSFSKFRYKSLRARAVMEDLLRNYNEITLQHIKSIDRNIYELNSDMEKIVLEPNHCDLYIDNSDEDILAYRNDTVEEMINEDVRNSMMLAEEQTQRNMVIGNKKKHNAERHRALENVTVKTDQNFYDDHADIETEHFVDENDNCYDTLDLSASTLVLDTLKNSEEPTLMSTESQNSDMDYTQDLHLITEQNSKVANVVRITDKKYHKIEIDHNKSEKKSRKRKKLHDKLKFESTSGNSAASDDLFNYEEIPKRESGTKVKIADSCYESNSDDDGKHERNHDLVKLKRIAEPNVNLCNICNYKCKLKISLTVHMKTHESEKLFSCDICEYKSKLRHNLNVHMRTHTDDILLACDTCKCKFKTRDELVLHSSSHASEMSFACLMCDYKCKLRHTLNVHMSKHISDERSDLIGHIKTHNLCEYKSVHEYNPKRAKR